MKSGNKFNVNDKVIVKPQSHNTYGIDKAQISEMQGHIYTVTHYYGDGFSWCYNINDSYFTFAEYMLAPADTSRYEINIISDGTNTKAVYKVNNKVINTVQSICHEDDFNMKTGVQICVDRLFNNDINIGDNVTVSNAGFLYVTYSEFFNKLCPKFATYYQYNQEIPRDEYKVKYIGKHLGSDSITLCVIQNQRKQCWLIDKQGIKKV